MMIKSTTTENFLIIKIGKHYLLIRKQDELLTENHSVISQMIDLRQSHIEEFNMLLILLVVSNMQSLE